MMSSYDMITSHCEVFWRMKFADCSQHRQSAEFPAVRYNAGPYASKVSEVTPASSPLQCTPPEKEVVRGTTASRYSSKSNSAAAALSARDTRSSSVGEDRARARD